MKGFRLFPLLFILADACVERYDLPAQIAKPMLVVDGMITNLPGPYTIELSISNDLNTNLNKAQPVIKATVKIVDDAGNEELLTEKSPGIYQTNANGIRGVIGRKYHTVIRVGEAEYQSTPQELLPPGEITDLMYNFELNVINQDIPAKPHDVLNVYINSQGVPGETNLFRWQWSSVHEILTFPELRTRQVGRPPITVPDPLPCSGYVPGPALTIQRIDSCSCCRCWVPEFDERALVSNNRAVKEDQFKNVYIMKVPVDRWRFSVRYYMKVEQFSLTEEAYDFWKLVQAQQEGEGSLFQPNSVKIRGNVYSTTSADEVLGLFGVSGVAQKEFFIDRRQVPWEVDVNIDTLKGSCLWQSPRATTQKPLFW